MSAEWVPFGCRWKIPSQSSRLLLALKLLRYSLVQYFGNLLCVTSVACSPCMGFSHGHRKEALDGFGLHAMNKLRSLALKAGGVLCSSLLHEKATHCVLETLFLCWEAWILYETSFKNQVLKKKAYIKLSNLYNKKKHLSAHSDLGAV